MPETRGLEAYRARIASEKRAAILDAAVAKFLEGGYARTSLEIIARAADVSTGTLFKHFPSKDALFGAIMARAWQNEPGVEHRMPPAGAPKIGLTEIGLDYARLLGAPNVAALFRVVIAEANRFPELGRELYHRGKAPFLARVSTYLDAEVAAKTLSISRVELARATHEFLGMINDQIFWPRLLLTDLVVADADVREVVGSAVRTLIARYQVAERRDGPAAGGSFI